MDSILIESKIGICPSTIAQRIEKQPYKLAVDNFRTLAQSYSPLEKLRIIGQSNRLI